jgi:hypothetical protein
MKIVEIKRYTTATMRGTGGVLCSPGRVGQLTAVHALADGVPTWFSRDDWMALVNDPETEYRAGSSGPRATS